MTGVNKTAFIGKPGEVIYKDLPIPTASDDNIVVKNKLVGINYADISQLYHILNLTGSDILGLEAAGEIVDVGKNVTQFKVGERVFYTGASTYAEYTTVPASSLPNVTPLPDYISNEQAVGLGLQGLTAYALAYKEYKVNKGDAFLVHAAAGGVGSILVQLLAQQGGKVIAVVSSREKVDFIKQFGAEHVINTSTENTVERVKEITGGKGVQVVYDSVGKATFNDSLLSLAVDGLLVQYGFASGIPETGFPPYLIGKHLKIHGSEVTAYVREGDGFNEWILSLFEDVKTGSIKTYVSKAYTLDQVSEAFGDLKGRKTVGKLTIKL